jgi:hypothetical protein
MRCSTGAWFEDEVETFIQARLADYHDWRRPPTDHTIVGLERDDPDERFVQWLGRIAT